MELRCVILCSLVSFVIATPHGYGTKGGAAAKAETGAVASAFSGISGLPLSIPGGAVSGSFSKSSSSSFASSSASSSSASYSFSGSGSAGLSGFLGSHENGRCKPGGCPTESGTNIPQEPSVESGLSTYNGAHAGAAASAITGVQNSATSPCSGYNCFTQKSSCEGKDCKGVVDTVNNAPKKCSSGQCNIKSESDTSASSSDFGDICAKGQCGVSQLSGSTPTGFIDNKECTSGNCAPDTGSGAPSKNYDSNDIPNSMIGLSSSTSTNQSSDNNKISNADDKLSGPDCSYGNCGSSDENLKPFKSYPNRPDLQSFDSGLLSSAKEPDYVPTAHATTAQQYNKSPNDITGKPLLQSGSLKPDEPYQNTYPKNQQTTCEGRHCANESVLKSPTNIQKPDGTTNCASGNCASNPSLLPTDIKKSGSKVPNGSSIITHLGCDSGKCDSFESNQPKEVPDSSNKCVSGNCASNSYQSSYLSSSESGTKSPSYSAKFPPTGSVNCASGKCSTYPTSQYADTDGSNFKTPTSPESGPENCGSGNCAGYSSSQPTNYDISASGPNAPNHYHSNPPTNCASGNCGSYPSIQQSGFDTSKLKNPIYHTGVSGSPNCVSGNCPSLAIPEFGTIGAKSPTYSPLPSSGSLPNCASGNCNSYPSSQHPGVDKNPTYSAGIPPALSNCASGNCGKPSLPNTGSKIPAHSPGVSFGSTPNCALGNCGPYPSSQYNGADLSGSNIPSYSATADSSASCTFGNCANVPSTRPNDFSGTVTKIPSGFPPSNRYPDFDVSGSKTPAYSGKPSLTNTESKTPSHSPGVSFSGTPNCALGNCSPYPTSQYNGVDVSGSNIPSYPATPDSSVTCTFGNCANVPSTRPNDFSSTVTKIPSSFIPSSRYPGFDVSGSKIPAYSEGTPNTQGTQSTGSSNCVSGNCDTQLPSSYPGFDTSKGSQSNCATGNCANVPPSGSTEFNTGHKAYDHFPTGSSGNCASGNCGSYPHGQYPGFGIPTSHSYGSHGSSGSKFPANSQDLSPTVSTNCPSGNCNVPPLQPTGVQASSIVPSQRNESIPAFIPLAPTRPAHVIGTYSPTSTHASIPTNSAVYPISNSGVLGGVHSTSTILDTLKHNSNQGQMYTGGFGGPPGILKPYEFKSPPPGGYYDTANNKPSHSPFCSSGNCVSQPGPNSVNNRPEITKNPISCGSAECGSHTNSPNYIQNGASNAVFTAAAASSTANAAVYTGGFGGPPGILKPYDNGKITSLPTFGKKSIGLQNSPVTSQHDANGSPGNKLNDFRDHAGTGAYASTGEYSNGNHAGYTKGVGGCTSGCGSSGSGSLDTSIGWIDGLEPPKTGNLNGLNNGLNAAGAVAKSTAGSISGTGANSFGFGGSFASSSAHASSGAATKGGYGR